MIRGRVSEKRHCSNAKGWRVRRSSAGQRAAQDAHMWQQAGHMIPQQGRRKSRVGTTEARKRDRVHRDRSFPSPSPPPPAVHLPRVGGERAVSEHLAARRVFRRMRLSAGSERQSHFPYISSSRLLFGLACALCLVFFCGHRLRSLSSVAFLCVVSFCPYLGCRPTTRRARMSGKNQGKTMFAEPKSAKMRNVIFHFFILFLTS